jgi:hypothetical protein
MIGTTRSPGVSAMDMERAVFRIHGLAIGVRSDVPAIMETVARSYDAFAFDGGNSDIAGVDAWIEVTRTVDGYRLVDSCERAAMATNETNALLGTLDRFVATVLDGLGRRGVLGTRAGVVVIDGRAVLLAGKSGRGKSILTLALVREGATWLTDELALIERDNRTVLPYPRAMHVSPRTVDLIPGLAFLRDRPSHDLGAGSEWSVSVDDLAGAFGAAVADAAPLGLIVLLDGRGEAHEDPRIERGSPAVATIELLRGTPAATGDFAGTMGRLGRIASQVPIIRLRATDPRRTARAVRRHVAGVA